eukprot:Hpha_TRINITY_DN24429_c0_g1::TRINITY_DN24429_c0_g1_i1::g.165671::m.165671
MAAGPPPPLRYTRAASDPPTLVSSQRSVVISGLPREATSKDVTDFAGYCGSIARVNPPVPDPNHPGHSFAVVTFAEEKAMDAALLLSGASVAGAEVTINCVEVVQAPLTLQDAMEKLSVSMSKKKNSRTPKSTPRLGDTMGTFRSAETPVQASGPSTPSPARRRPKKRKEKQDVFARIQRISDSLRPSEKMALTGVGLLAGAAAVSHLKAVKKKQQKEARRDAEALAMAYDRLFFE